MRSCCTASARLRFVDFGNHDQVAVQDFRQPGDKLREFLVHAGPPLTSVAQPLRMADRRGGQANAAMALTIPD